jgi:hypothetical protein
VAAVFAVRSWGARTAAAELAAAALALLMPVLLLQSVHPSLSAQFLLLLAWGLAGRLARRERPRSSDRHLFTGLAVLALGIHPYLAVMVLAMMLGSAADSVSAGRLPPIRAASWLGRTLALAAAWMVAGGYLSTIRSSDGGYGVYATYLSGPLRPVTSDLLPRDPLGDLHPSHPGYSYLGLGILALAAIALGGNRQRLRGLVTANQCLAASLVLLLAWALTPAVRIWTDQPLDLAAGLAAGLGSHRAAGVAASVAGLGLATAGLVSWWARTDPGRRPLSLSLPLLCGATLAMSAAGLAAPSLIDALTVQFRASGRFAWPALYGVPVLAAAGLDAGLRKVASGLGTRTAPLVGVAAAAIAVGLQLADTGTLRQEARSSLVPGGKARRDHVSYVTELVEAHDRVRLAPDFRCTYYPEGVVAFIDVTQTASAAGKPIDRIYSARQGEPSECVVAQHPDLSDPGTVWFLIEPVSLLDGADDPAGVRSRCRRRDTINVCSHHWDDLAPEVVAHFDPIDD